MIESTLFKSIKMVLPEGEREGDLLVENGVIKAIGPSITSSAEQIIKEKHLTLIPGCIDPHVHFRDPGITHKEDLESGSFAAAAGGVTSFFDMPNTNPATISLKSMADKKIIASEKSIVNYNFFIGATNDNLEECLKAQNIAGIKIFVGSSTGNMLVNEPTILEEFFKKSNKVIAVHSEDEELIRKNEQELKGSNDPITHLHIRDEQAAVKCTTMLLELAKKHQTRLHICHLTTWQEVDMFAELKEYPFITTEVTPHHLLLSAPNIYDVKGTFAQANPPIRDKRHQQALFGALQEGIIHCIGSDHAPHLPEEKIKAFPNAPSGIPAVESTLPLLLNQVNKGHFSLEQIVHLTSKAPAQCYNIQFKGMLKEGYDADLVLIDMDQKKEVNPKQHKSKSKWSIYEGQTLQGWPMATYVNGNLAYREGDIFSAIKGKEIVLGS